MKLSWIVVGIVVAGLAISLGLSLSSSNEVQPVITGKVCQDNRYGGILGCLDDWDYPVTQCQVILRYAGAEGTVEIDGQRSPWSVYVSNGKIIDQVQVDENGVYSFKLDWQPEGVFVGGGIDQKITTALYQVELLVPVQGFNTQKVIGSSQVRVKLTEETETILGPIFLLSQ